MLGRINLIFLLLLLVSKALTAQDITIGGKVLDAETREPLAFVNIGIKGTLRGAVTDIDGRWKLEKLQAGDSLIFTYIGYQALRISAEVYKKKYTNQLITLQKTAYALKEIVVLPGENPAHRIIQKVLDNKRKNNWERLQSFSYTTYNRFHFTAEELDSTGKAMMEEIKPSGAVSFSVEPSKDSNEVKQSEVDSVLSRQHLFLTESITEKKFKYPDKVSEKVIASKVSGTQDARFSLFATQFGNFNIYKDYIEVGEKQYLSPVSYGCIKNYFFILEDSIPSETDTTYIISFRPKKGKLFDGFQGLLYVSTNQYAVKNVLARPKSMDNGLNTEIQQQFVLVDNKQWFPEQINSKIIYPGFNLGQKPMVGRGRMYINKVELNPELKNREFTSTVMYIDKNAHLKTDTFWNNHRADTLSKLDKQTYQVLDSVGKAVKIDQKIKIFEALLYGRLPIGPVDILLNKIADYNGFEGFRLGAGLATNDRLSKYFSLSGYGAYGFKDKAWKYGSELRITPFPVSDFTFGAGYYNDVEELGSVKLPLDRRPNLREPNRKLNISEMAYVERKEVFMEISPFRYLSVKPSYRQSFEKMVNNYEYSGAGGENHKTFNFEEVSLALRYAYKEKFIQALNRKYSLGTNSPIIWMQFTKGLENGNTGNYDFNKIDFKIEKKVRIKLAGHSIFQLRGGFVEGNAPLLRMYNGNGNKGHIPLAAENTFETMRPYEFFSDRYLSLFYTHNFEKMLFKIGKFQPNLLLHTNVGFGSMKNPSVHKGIDFKTMEKGYFESGFTIDNILTGFANYGIGVFYRYGPYADPSWNKNFAVKLTISTSLFGR